MRLCVSWTLLKQAETCSYYHPLLNIFLEIVVLMTDTYTYCFEQQ